MNENEIKQNIQIEVSANLNNSAAELGEIARLAKQIIDRNPVMASSYDGIRTAVARATRQISGNLREISESTQKMGSGFDTFENKVNRSMGSVANSTNQVLSPISKLASITGAGLGFENAFRQAMSFDKQMLGLGNQFRKYGQTAGDMESRINSLSSKLKMSKTDVAGLIAQMEKSGNFQSIDMMAKSLENMTRMVGSDRDAIAQLSSELDSFTQQFPDLEQATRRLNAADKERLEAQSQQLFMTGQISKSQYQQITDYAKGATQLTYAEEKKRAELQSTQAAFAEMQKTFQDVAISIGKTLEPAFKTVNGMMAAMPGFAKTAIIALGGVAAIAGTASGAAGMITGGSNIAKRVGGLLGFGKAKKGEEGEAAEPEDGVTSGIEKAKETIEGFLGGKKGVETSEKGIQKVFVVGGRISIAEGMIGSNEEDGISDLFSQVEDLFGGKEGKAGAKAAGKVEGAAVREVGAAAKAGKVGKVGKIGSLIGKGDDILESAGSAFSKLGKFAKVVPILSAAIGSVDVAGSLKKDKEGNRDWAGAGMNAAAVGAAFIPVVGPFLSAGITAFSFLRTAVKDNKLDTKYEAGLGAAATPDATLTNLGTTLGKMGDQFNANRVKEESIFHSFGQSVDEWGGTVKTLAIGLAPLTGGLSLLALAITGNGDSGGTDREKFAAAMRQSMEQATNQMTSMMGGDRGRAETVVRNQARESTLATNARRMQDIDNEKNDSATTWSDWGNNAISLGGLIGNDATEQRSANAFEQTQKAKADSDAQLRIALGKSPDEYISEKERYGLKNGQTMARTMGAVDSQAMYDREVTGARDVTTRIRDGTGAPVTSRDIQGQMNQVNNISAQMEGQMVVDNRTGQTVGIDDESYAKAKADAEALAKAIEEGEKANRDMTGAKREQSVLEGTITSMEEKRAPYVKARAAVEAQIAQQTMIIQDRVKATNDLYAAQAQMLTTINSLADAGGASLEDYAGRLDQQLGQMAESSRKAMEAQDALLAMEQAAADNSKVVNANRVTSLTAERDNVTTTPEKKAEIQQQIDQIQAADSATDQKIAAARTQQEQRRLNQPVEMARAEIQAKGNMGAERLGYSESRRALAGSSADLAESAGNSAAALALRQAQGSELAGQRQILEARRATLDTSITQAETQQAQAEAAFTAARGTDQEAAAQANLDAATLRVNGLMDRRAKTQDDLNKKTREEIDNAIALGKVNERAIAQQQTIIGLASAQAEILSMGGNSAGAMAARDTAIGATREQQQLKGQEVSNLQGAVNVATADQSAAAAELASATTDQARAAAQAKYNAAVAKVKDIQQALNQAKTDEVQLVKTLIEQEKQRINANQGTLDMQEAGLQNMQAQIELADSIGVGLRSNIAQRMQAVEQMRAMEGSMREQLEVAQQTETAARARAEAARGTDQEAAAMAEVNQAITTRLNKETAVFQIQKRQADMTKSLRDGYLDAIMAMRSGSGMIDKIVVDQTKNSGMAVERIGALASMTTGGRGGAQGSGRTAAARFTEDGVVMNEDNVGYNTFDGSGRFTGPINAGMASQRVAVANDRITDQGAAASRTGVGEAGLADPRSNTAGPQPSPVGRGRMPVSNPTMPQGGPGIMPVTNGPAGPMAPPGTVVPFTDPRASRNERAANPVPAPVAGLNPGADATATPEIAVLQGQRDLMVQMLAALQVIAASSSNSNSTLVPVRPDVRPTTTVDPTIVNRTPDTATPTPPPNGGRLPPLNITINITELREMSAQISRQLAAAFRESGLLTSNGR